MTRLGGALADRQTLNENPGYYVRVVLNWVKPLKRAEIPVSFRLEDLMTNARVKS